MLALLPGAELKAQGAAAGSGGLPPWAVPVLRLVSATHVVPTTGLVVSDDGLVLVPIEFVAGGEELVVLDGGPDPVRYGRPATVASRWPLQGLAILQAERLRRPPVTLAASNPVDGEVVRLLAFPPAELIEAGQSSVMELVALEQQENGLRPARPGLPNLTGALVNACGQLVGFSAARGVQGMGRSGNTLYRWRDLLAQDLAAAGLTLASAGCDNVLEMPRPAPASSAGVITEQEKEQETGNENNDEDDIAQAKSDLDEAELKSTAEPSAEPGAAEKEVTAEDPASATVLEAEPGPGPEPEPEPRADPGPESESIPVPEAEPDPVAPAKPELGEEGEPDARPVISSEAQSESSSGPSTASEASRVMVTPVLVPLGLALVALLLALWWRRRSGRSQTASGTAASGRVPAAPAFCLRPIIDDEDGSREQAARADIPLHTVAGRIDLLLGRHGTDLLLEHPTVSRRHARLTGSPGALQVTDLGSSNGTRVNGRLCEANTAISLAPGDRLALGALEWEVRPGVEPRVEPNRQEES